ncbi:HAMP domain-containing sensor histidine kinase [uncultured Chitinophaga sp.]|uniref:sensor histidine kinase n=1 Tax=uncultured Chitinophaga sp. TaxID=339340 RepID=UPI00261A915F|nr:HAMP domain-containing sensor histidine kinase [uncultured Chitinophaga sp.]
MTMVTILCVWNILGAHYHLAFSYAFLIGCMLLIFQLQHLGFFPAARYFTVALIPGFFSYISLCYQNNTELFLLLDIAVIVLLLNSWWMIIALSLLNMFAFIFIRIYNGNHQPLIEALPASRDVISATNLFVLMTMVLLYYKYEQQRDRRQLETLNRQNEEKALRLENLNRSKEQILSSLSHNLLQPLSALRNVLQKEEELSPARISDFTGRFKSNLDNVLLSLENTLRWSHTRLKGLIPAPRYCNVYDTLEQVASQFKAQLSEKRLRFIRRCDRDILVYADPTHLQLIIRNLVSNAVKFTPKGGSIRITVSNANGLVEISVTDTGIGMNEDLLEQLFNPEQRTHSSGTENEPGAGLGLLLVKELVELNGGHLTVTSVLKAGATFQVILPASYI